MAWATLFRPLSSAAACFGAAVCMFLSQHVANEPFGLWRVILGFAVVMLIACALMADNDIADLNSDGAETSQRKWRPLVRGIIKERTAKLVAGVFMGIAIFLTLFLGIAAVLLAALCLLLGIGYNHSFKHHPVGVFVLAWGISSLVIWGSAVATPTHPFVLIYLFIGLFCEEICREILLTVQDHYPDKEARFMTISVRFGQKNSMVLALLFLALGTPFLLSPIFGLFDSFKFQGISYACGVVGLITFLVATWVNCYSILDVRNKLIINKVFEVNLRHILRWYMLIFQTMILLEVLL